MVFKAVYFNNFVKFNISLLLIHVFKMRCIFYNISTEMNRIGFLLNIFFKLKGTVRPKAKILS